MKSKKVGKKTQPCSRGREGWSSGTDNQNPYIFESELVLQLEGYGSGGNFFRSPVRKRVKRQEKRKTLWGNTGYLPLARSPLMGNLVVFCDFHGLISTPQRQGFMDVNSEIFKNVRKLPKLPVSSSVAVLEVNKGFLGWTA